MMSESVNRVSQQTKAKQLSQQTKAVSSVLNEQLLPKV